MMNHTIYLTDGGTYTSSVLHKKFCVYLLNLATIDFLLTALKDVISLLEYHDCHVFYTNQLCCYFVAGVLAKPSD